MRSLRLVTIVSCAAVTCLTSCGRREAELAQHQQAIVSAAATAEMIRDAWLAGRVAGPYARVALERGLRLLDDDRRTLTLSPDLLDDAEGADLSQKAEQLVRAIAAISRAIADGDVTRVRAIVIPAVATSAS